MGIDDIIEAMDGSQETPDNGATLEPFDRESWIEKKEIEREQVFTLMNNTAERVASNPELFQSYLDVESKFPRYSVGNVLLIAAQNAKATKVADYDTWKQNGVYIKKDEKGILLLEPSSEYTRSDGTTGVKFAVKRVFDIAQTTSREQLNKPAPIDERKLIQALITDAPCKLKMDDNIRSGQNALYQPEDKTVHIRHGMSAEQMFRAVSKELALARMDNGDYKRADCLFRAEAVSYLLCRRFNVEPNAEALAKMPESFSGKEGKEIKAELEKIRETANEMGQSISHTLDKTKKPVDRGDDAR